MGFCQDEASDACFFLLCTWKGVVGGGHVQADVVRCASSKHCALGSWYCSLGCDMAWGPGAPIRFCFS